MSTYDVGEKQFGGVFTVVPMAVIDPLPQQLNWRLGAILLFRRHVEVVHKRNTFLAQRRSVHTFPASGSPQAHALHRLHTSTMRFHPIGLHVLNTNIVALFGKDY